ncbi:MAG: DUF4349 domain-containing protein [Anaerolineae bacterium]
MVENRTLAKATALVAIALTLIVAVRCAPAARPAPTPAPGMAREVVVEKAVKAPSAPTEAEWLAYVGERMIVWTGNISLIVKDVEGSLEEAEAIAKGLGGYVVSSNSWYQEEQLRARLTIRVPADSFDAAMARLRAMAVRVESRNVSTQDVTEEYTDLDSRLRNLEATERELLELLSEVRQRTHKAEEILAVHRELMNIRGQIEQVKGRMQYLEKMTAMATINIELIPSALARPLIVAGWQPAGTLASALRALIRALQFIVDIAIWAVIFILPILLLFLIPLALIWLAWRQWRRRRAAG